MSILVTLNQEVSIGYGSWRIPAFLRLILHVLQARETPWLTIFPTDFDCGFPDRSRPLGPSNEVQYRDKLRKESGRGRGCCVARAGVRRYRGGERDVAQG